MTRRNILIVIAGVCLLALIAIALLAPWRVVAVTFLIATVLGAGAALQYLQRIRRDVRDVSAVLLTVRDEMAATERVAEGRHERTLEAIARQSSVLEAHERRFLELLREVPERVAIRSAIDIARARNSLAAELSGQDERSAAGSDLTAGRDS